MADETRVVEDFEFYFASGDPLFLTGLPTGTVTCTRVDREELELRITEGEERTEAIGINLARVNCWRRVSRFETIEQPLPEHFGETEPQS